MVKLRQKHRKLQKVRKFSTPSGNRNFKLRGVGLPKPKAQSRCKQLKRTYKHCRIAKAKGGYGVYAHGKK